MKFAALTAFAATLLAVSSVGQVPDWTQVTTAINPSARHEHAMAYDSARGRVVMFGGSFQPNETWEYDGVNWTQVTTASSPSARYAPAMVYDSVRGKVVMFGGVAGNWLNDTWEYDGVNWTQVTTASSPSARFGHAMVYDSVRGKVVMFGGYAGNWLNDTWEYDGASWTQVTTASSPNARDSHAMVYDSGRGKVVLFGGGGIAGLGNDTWEYDGVNWTQISPTASSPGAHWDHAMAYDSVRGKVVMFGGLGSAGLGNDTWEYDGGVPFIATATPYGTGCGTPALDFTPTSNPILGTTAGALISNAPNQFAGVVMGWSDTHLAGAPLLPLDLAFIGMPGCSMLVSNEVIGLPTTQLTASTLQFDYAIPSSLVLLGAHVYVQAYCVAPGANPLQVIVSNGIDWLIGNQ
jgi:hypothetical protein